MTRDERIRLVYARHRQFTRREAAYVLGLSPAWVERHRFERERGAFLSWEEVVQLGSHLWTDREIEAALGERAAAVLPALRLLTKLTIEVPRYTVVQLRYMARRRHIGIGELVKRELNIWAYEAEEIEDAVPGFIAASDFPYGEAKPR